MPGNVLGPWDRVFGDHRLVGGVKQQTSKCIDGMSNGGGAEHAEDREYERCRWARDVHETSVSGCLGGKPGRLAFKRE